MDTLKFYVYLSRDKVDMLFAQLPSAVVGRIVREYSIDAKVLKATRTEEMNPNTHLVRRLQAVVNYIVESENVGTVDDPKRYIRGTMPMIMVPFEFDRDRWQDPDHAVVTFWGDTEQTTVLLGGSQKHLLGVIAPDRPEIGYSHILQWIIQEKLNREDFVTKKESDYLAFIIDSRADISRLWHGPLQRFEFMAKRIASGRIETHGGRQALLATPLYVSLAE